MTDTLATYLHDHLAGAEHALETLRNLSERHANEPLGRFAAELHGGIDADRNVLGGLAERIGAGSSQVKEMGAWVSEKITRMRLNDSANGFGTFEALEFLELGIRGKRLLWVVLSEAATNDERLQGLDYGKLVERAETQEAQVEKRRLQIGRTALR
jgi:hypothetical protein